MSNTTENWDYCQIEFQVMQDFVLSRQTANHKQLWLRYYAWATGPNGDYMAGRSHKIPLAYMAGAPILAPQEENLGHTNTLQILIEQLQKEGWEVVKDKSGVWWEHRLRRPSQAGPSRIQRIASFFKFH